jgi:hypothetical protein
MRGRFFRTLLTGIALALGALPAAAQSGFSIIGLSAAPDSYVARKTVPFGEEFELYVILTGPAGESPLPWILDSVDWAVLQACCGGSPAYMIHAELLTDGLSQTGDPTLGVTSTGVGCVQRDVLVLARLLFTWIYTPTRHFYLGAAAMTAALTCDQDIQFLDSRSVEIIPTGITPAEDASWGAVKSLYR